jgi:hypothetical protein
MAQDNSLYVTLADAPVPGGAPAVNPQPSSARGNSKLYVSLDDAPKPTMPPSSAPSTPATTPPSNSAHAGWLQNALTSVKQSWPYAVGRGVLTGAVGMPGDLEQLGAQTIPKALGFTPDKSTLFPTSGDVSRFLAAHGAPPSPTHPDVESVSQFAGGMLAPIGELGAPLEKGTAALARARTGASILDKSAEGGRGLVSSILGGRPANQEIADAAKAAKRAGYTLAPGAATSVGKATTDIANFGEGAAAAKNYDLYANTLKRVMGMRPSEELNPETLARAVQEIPARFETSLVGKQVTITPEVQGAVRSLVTSKPQFAQEVMADRGIAAAFNKAEKGGKMSATDWFKAIQRLKQMRYSTASAADKAALSDVISAAEKPFFQSGPATAREYRVFNRQYRAAATLLDATKGDNVFLQTGKINPSRVWNSIETNTRTESAQAKAMLAKDPFVRTTRTVAKLGLIPTARSLSEEPALNLATASMHAVGLPVHLAANSANAIPKLLSAVGGGKALRAFYESPTGQAALMGARPLTRAEIELLRGIPKVAAATQGYIGPTTNK